MLSLDNAYSEEELRAFDERVRRGLGETGAVPDARRLRRRAEDRRPEHRADLRGRRARARRHARRRRARRGRHAERPDDPRDSAAAARRRRSGPHRGARRGLSAAQGVRADQHASARRRASRCSQNPRNAAAGTLRNLDPALVAKRGLSAFFYQLVAADDRRRGRRHARARRSSSCAAWGCPSSRTGGAAPAIDELVAFCREWEEKRRSLDFDTDGVVIKVDALAQRARARRDEQVPALGDRVQVPGGAEDDAAASRSK